MTPDTKMSAGSLDLLETAVSEAHKNLDLQYHLMVRLSDTPVRHMILRLLSCTLATFQWLQRQRNGARRKDHFR